MIVAMCADVVFNKEIDTTNQYISFGGYEIISNNGRSVSFDFEKYYNRIDKNVMHIEGRYVDTECFPGASDLESYVIDIDEFLDFFVYTDESNPIELDIEPIMIKNVHFITDNDDIIFINDKCLQRCLT